MPSKLEFYAQMADETAGRLTGSFQNWTAFLTTASRLYKYPFNEQLMIYAQRPEATACAEYDLWNRQMRRYVRRGSRGIALIDASGDRPKLKYVFDVSDTGGREDSRRLFLWELRQEHTAPVSEALERRYGVSGEHGLADQLEQVAAQLAGEYWDEHRRDILDIVDGSFLEEYDEFNIGAAFRNAAAVSITYALLSRCGMAPEEYFQHEDFLSIFDWNTPDTVYALGTAVSQTNQEVLRQIGVTIINYEREKYAERSNDNERADLYQERGLSDPRPEAVRDGGETPGQVREDAKEVPSGASPGAVEPPAADREAVPAPAGDRRDGQPEAGADAAGAGESGGRDGGHEGGRPDEMDGPDEQLQSAGGGNDPERAGIQLTIREAPDGGQLSFFPSEAEQIALIDEAESVINTPFAFSFAQEEIDHFLRLGSNADQHRLRIAAEFSKGKAVEENAEYLKTLFHGGNGIKTGDKSISAWYGEDGIRLAKGNTARYSTTAQVISWQDAAERIGQLLEAGEYATNVELAEAPGHERRMLAQSLLYLHHDFSDEAHAQQYMPSMKLVRGGGYPDEVERLAEKLQDPAFRQALMEEYAAFWMAYHQDRGLLRFHYHKPREIWNALKDLALPRREFSTAMAEVPEVTQFITEDEVNEALSGGSGVSGGKGRIYDYFRETHTPKEKADFLKNEFGTGGRSHALSRAGGSNENHDGKGIRYQKDGCPEVRLNWNQVVKRIDELIRKGRYMSPEAIAEHEAAKEAKAQETAARETVEETVSRPEPVQEKPEPDFPQSPAFSAYNDVKHGHPDDIVLFQVGDFFEMYGEDARQAAEMLDLNLTTRPIPGAGRIDMCGIPAHTLEQYVEQLRDKFDVTISTVTDGERHAYSLRSIDHEAEQAINAHEAEYGADGYRAFPGNAPEQEAAPPRQEAPAPTPRREITQDDIDEALRQWNGSIESKRAVVRYMAEHAREKDTAAWLSREYGGNPDKSLYVTVTGTDAEVELPWPKVQRRIAQLIQQEKFYTEAEYERMDDVDPIAIRERLAQSGIVDGQVVDEAALNSDPFIRQVMADAERVSQEEEHTPEPALGPSPTVREIYEHYLPIVRERVLEDQAYRNACANSDRENVYLEGDAAIKRAVSTIEDASFVNLYYGLGGFHNSLRRDILDETYPVLSAVAEEPIPRYEVTMTSDAFPDPEDAFAIRDNENDDYYILSDGIVPTFATEQEAEEYLRQLQPEQSVPETTQETEGSFVYQGFRFEPVGTLRENFDTAIKHTVSHNELGLSAYADAMRPYIYEDFYAAVGGTTADVFRCLETGKLYLPGTNELFEYTGPFEPYQEKSLETAQEETMPDPAPEPETADAPASQRDPLAPAYSVGDTVYLDDKPFEITEVSDYNVQLRDPTLFYPIFRAESKTRFEVMLYQDSRNAPITEYLAQDLNNSDSDLQDVLTWDGGLLELRDKETIAGWFRAGESNTRIAQYLSDTYAGRSDTMMMQTGEETDYFATTTGVEINIQDKYSTKHTFSWIEITRILRTMYQQERDGFYHEPVSREPVTLEGIPAYKVGDSVVVPYPGRDIKGTIGYIGEKDIRIDTGPYSWSHETINRDQFEAFIRQDERNAHLFVPEEKAAEQPQIISEPVAFYPGEKNNLPFDVVIERLRVDEPEPPAPDLEEALDANPISIQIGGEWQTFPNTAAAETAAYEEYKDNIRRNAQNFHITDDNLGVGGPKAKYQANINAIRLLKSLEAEGAQASPEQQEVLSRYVGWGGLPDAFDPDKENWSAEYAELRELLTPEEYEAARASTLNAHYTSPTVIKAIYEAVGNMGFQAGNILEPSMGVGNFFGLLPEEMQKSRLYGVELDSITGRIAKQLYPKANIEVKGYEKTDFSNDFFDLAIGNVPFGQYQVNDRAYNQLGFSIHDYFFAKTLDKVRPGGVVAFLTSRYTMDKQSPEVRRHIAQRAELLGAIRLPNNAFRANAGTDVVTDILFLQKRDRPIDIVPDWVHLGENEDGFSINSYFIDHPEMILGRQTSESTQYGRQDFTVAPIEGLELSDQLHDAIKYIRGTYQEAELPELGDGGDIGKTIPADPNVKNFSYTVVDGEVYYRENSVMVRPELNATATERVKGMVELRECVQQLINLQMWDSDAVSIYKEQQRLNQLYDSFTAKYGLINSRGNSLAFADDSSYFLLCSLEVLDEDGNLKRKADMFSKRTIRQARAVTSVDTASEALAVSIAEKARVDMPYMAQLSGKTEDELAAELSGVIFRLPEPVDSQGNPRYVTADEYLSGDVRQKLARAKRAAEQAPDVFGVNVRALEAAQPPDLDASEIDVRLGATWIDKEYIQQFMEELLAPSYYLRRNIKVNFSEFTAEWNITGKNLPSMTDVAAYMTYGTERANAYRILEDTLNLRDIRIYDTVRDPDGRERRVLNSKETTLAQQKQQAIKDAFRDWIWRDPERRQHLVQKYNEIFNSTRPREYDGSHITFSGMNPEITLREHQKNAIAHVLYGDNVLLAHEVGAGKTFEMVAAAMESKRLGLCQKSLFAVPNHLTEQWASEFLRLYPSANILVATRKDFETRNRKKFCARIATGDYDAIIMGHSQFERIPVSIERQERLLQEQIWEIEAGLEELKASGAERFTVKSLERTKRNLEARLDKLHDSRRKDDVVTFEQLGVDRLFVDEAHSFKNLFLYTKMRNVAGLSTTDAQKSSDMLLKCRYIDEVTGGKGVVFATGTPVSNSMTELYTMMRYLQHDMLRQRGWAHFDCWASQFGETVTAIELAPEGTGYRARTRFAKFSNLPELMNHFREAADIKTSDQLNLPKPEAVYHTEVAQPTEHQQAMVQELSERAAEVHTGKIDPAIDNMLKITSDGRKLGLDQRIINPMLPDDPGSKVNRCVDNILRIWQDGQADRLTQLVFCDISTPKGRATEQQQKAAKAAGDKTILGAELHALEAALPDAEPETPFSVYDDIRAKLIQSGIPAHEIAFIHDANTEARKKELFAKVRTGQVRVLMGSTFKMGAGMNVQDRLVALHDLDCPWRPGDLEQRSGRIIRQGNQNPEVHIYRYVTEGTFDSYLWQTVENKQKFISQIMTSKSPVRSCEDVDETALSYAEIKALCAGDERIKEKMDLDIDVSRLRLMKANHQSQQYRLEDNLLKYFPEKIEQNKGFIAGFEQDMKTLAEHPHPADGFAGMVVRGDTLTDKDNAGAAILEACKEVKGIEAVEIGSYRGFSMRLSFEGFKHCLTLKGAMSHKVELGQDARGNLTRIENALAQMPERLAATQAQLDNLHRQVEAARAELGKPFPQEAELQTKSARLAELNALLDMDNRGGREQPAAETVAKTVRPSVLHKLKTPPVHGSGDRKKSQRLEER